MPTQADLVKDFAAARPSLRDLETHPSTFAWSRFPRTRFLAELLIPTSIVACFGLARAKFKTPFATVSITDEVTPIALRDDTPAALFLLCRRCCCLGRDKSAVCRKETLGLGVRKPDTAGNQKSSHNVFETIVKATERSPGGVAWCVMMMQGVCVSGSGVLAMCVVGGARDCQHTMVEDDP